ncbi:hypothetical protein ACLK11_12710 [Escherichia coli]
METGCCAWRSACIALLLSVYPLWRGARGDARMMASSRLFAWLLFMSVAGAFLVLVNAFVVNDFTVTYVASNSNTQLPVWYRVAATWARMKARYCCGCC